MRPTCTPGVHLVTFSEHAMDRKTFILPDPKTPMGILRRYLHIVALLQGNRDPVEWNGTSLASMLSVEEDEAPTDKTIREYIKKHLKEELGLQVDVRKGGRKIELAEPITEEMMLRIASIYSSFVVHDSNRELILKNLIQRHPVDCLWMLARIHFAKLEKRQVKFEYTTNAGARLSGVILNPHFMVFRTNNLYLHGRRPGYHERRQFIVNRIENLVVTDQFFDEEIQDPAEVYRESLGSFIGDRYHVKIRFSEAVLQSIEQVISILEPEMKKLDDGWHEASFTVADDVYLCKQLFFYGKEVEILEPQELRDAMKEMLEESLAVYK